MQSAQAKLLAQGVSGVTPQGMLNGSVELVSTLAILHLSLITSFTMTSIFTGHAQELSQAGRYIDV